MKLLFTTTWKGASGAAESFVGSAAKTQALLKRFTRAGILATTVQIGVSPDRMRDFPSGVFLDSGGKVYWALQIIRPAKRPIRPLKACIHGRTWLVTGERLLPDGSTERLTASAWGYTEREARRFYGKLQDLANRQRLNGPARRWEDTELRFVEVKEVES